MRHLILIVMPIVLLCASAAALAGAKEDVAGAVDKLSASDGYSWNTSATNAQGPMPGGGEGKIVRDGLTMLKLGVQDSYTLILFKDGKGAYRPPEGEWQSAGAAGPTTRGAGGADGRMIDNLVQTYVPPAAQAHDLVEKARDLKKADDGSYVGTLSTDDAAALIQRRVLRAGGDGRVAIDDAVGGLKFWIAENGDLRKFELHLEGKINSNGQPRPLSRTTTVEIKDIGKTHIDVPDEARAKMG